MKKIIITGSEGLLGKEISKYLEKDNKILKLDLKLGDNLCDENYVKNWFSKNHAEYLINCFAINDHLTKKRKKETLFEYDLESSVTFVYLPVIISSPVIYEPSLTKPFSSNLEKDDKFFFLIFC